MIVAKANIKPRPFDQPNALRCQRTSLMASQLFNAKSTDTKFNNTRRTAKEAITKTVKENAWYLVRLNEEMKDAKQIKYRYFKPLELREFAAIISIKRLNNANDKKKREVINAAELYLIDEKNIVL